ncbi:MAG: hypothetical protein HOW73_08145 [Polyangiaceae bacterium]|nr:hypothetical protein [Polyangiaceae bacterium]
MRPAITFAFAFSLPLVGCGDSSDPPPDDGGPDPETCTIQLDDPTTITTFPDRSMLVEDATTETGLRLHYDPERYSDLTEKLDGFVPTLTDDLSEVDGFGINAEAFFRFSRPFDSALLPAADQAGATSAAGFVVLAETPYLMPAVLSTTTDGTLLLSPLTPLPARTEVAAYATRALTQAAGGCLEPSAPTADLLASPDAPTADAIAALVDLGAVADSAELVAITAYPTQSIFEDGIAIAADIAARDFDFVAPPACADSDEFTRCEAAFVAGDYRDQEDGVIRRAAGEEAAPVATYTVPFTIWLPRTRKGPVPTIVFQHGLSSDREWGGSRLAKHFGPLGIAVVAIDALEHGEHPTVTEERTALETVQAFFGISFDMMQTRAFQVARLRDNVAQSTFDRLQFIRLLTQHPDVDGVQGADLDLDKLAFMGVSAGGIMGPQHVALDGTIGAAVIAVSGGRIAAIIKDSPAFSIIVSSFRPPEATPEDMRRLFPIAQTILDRSDPASWAPTLYGTRVPGVPGRPDVLLGVAIDDGVVPNSATWEIGRAIGVPMVEDVLEPQLGFERVEGPISGNITIGDEHATAGMVQFDVVPGEGGLVKADHNNTLESSLGLEAWTHFLTTHFAGSAEIRDPYEALGIEHP